MYWYLSFLRPPPVSLVLPSEGVVITPQVANDLRTELRAMPTQIQYTWQRVHPSWTAPTRPVDLTVFSPPASTYRPLTVPLPRAARAGEKWRLGLLEPPAAAPGSQALLSLTLGDPGVLGVWSEGIELKAAPGGLTGAGNRGAAPRGVGVDRKREGKDKGGKEKDPKSKDKKDKDKRPRDDTPKQNRITRAWSLPTEAGGDLKLVEQTSFDLDKKVWDSGLALASWLWRHLPGGTHSNAAAQAVMSLLRPEATVLELGSGTGLVSIALAQLHDAASRQQQAQAQTMGSADARVASPAHGTITATDLESAMEIMAENIGYNRVDVAARILDWEEDMPAWVETNWPRVVIAADVTYNTASFPCLVRTLSALVRRGTPLLLAYKQRDAAERELWAMLEAEGITAEMVDTVQGAEEVGETEIWVMRRREVSE